MLYLRKNRCTNQGGREMSEQLTKIEVAQNLLERINELAKSCNDENVVWMIKELSEARRILLNS